MSGTAATGDALRFGVIFPHSEVGAGPDGARQFVMAVEEAGFDYLGAPEHVLGSDSVTRPGWKGPYDTDDPFFEVFVLFGFFAGLTQLELDTAILVLPQRQTALVAKQAATLDVLTGGKLRLGVAGGWNEPEFQALGTEFTNRGARMNEQMEVLRLLWTERVVSFEGQFHTLDRVGIYPLPVQRPIPLWVGGGVQRMPALTKENRPRVIERVARFGDGWISGPNDPPEHVAASFAVIRQVAEEHGRDPSGIGLQVAVHVNEMADLAQVPERVAAFRAAGATHVTIETRNVGLVLGQHLELIEALAPVIASER